MKTIVTLMLSFAIVAGLNAQKIKNEDVPQSVKTKFKELYPNVQKVKWEKEDANFEAEFENGNSETSVVFDGTGNLLETETEISADALPQQVKEYVQKNLAGKKIKEASKIVNSKNQVIYELEIDKTEYLISQDGKLINKKEEKEDDDDK